MRTNKADVPALVHVKRVSDARLNVGEVDAQACRLPRLPASSRQLASQLLEGLLVAVHRLFDCEQNKNERRVACGEERAPAIQIQIIKPNFSQVYTAVSCCTGRHRTVTFSLAHTNCHMRKFSAVPYLSEY